jgi:hypothetical protein
MNEKVPRNGEQYIPSGKVQGDETAMPNKGTGTGVTDTYGADLSQDATNREGSIRGATRSDGKEFA